MLIAEDNGRILALAVGIRQNFIGQMDLIRFIPTKISRSQFDQLLRAREFLGAGDLGFRWARWLNLSSLHYLSMLPLF